jgi:histidine ammonia-lyase
MARSLRKKVVLDGESLTLEQLEAIADGAPARLSPEARKRVRASRNCVERAVRGGATVYGVNTGFGKLARIRIDDDKLGRLQLNLIRSHSVGVGEPFDDATVRAILALRANCLARGHSGIRLQTLEHLIAMLNANVLPRVPSQGSVGASGDLAPLAHIALGAIGEGRVRTGGKERSAKKALSDAGLEPCVLAAKEGLALINGTQVMTAVGALTLKRAERLTRLADIIGAMSLEALLGSHRAFEARVHASRPHPGQRTSAMNISRLIADGTLAASHEHCDRVQDAYSLRCIPQVHGAVRDALAHVRWVLAIEANSSTDNPMVFADEGDLVSAGNFHGQPVSLALDHLAIACCSLATISERRIDRLMDPSRNEGLPAFLTDDPGLNSGFMMAHVTAAALTSENKVLAHPASVDSISTSAAQEDHVSMGVHAARQAQSIVDHVETVLAIELLTAAQAIDLRAPLKGGRGVIAAQRILRKVVPRLAADRVLSNDIEKALTVMRSGDIERACIRAIGPLA